MGTTSLDASWEPSASEKTECCGAWKWAHHAGAWEDVPAQADSITVLDLTPLLLEGIVIHRVDVVDVALEEKLYSGWGFERVG